MRKNKYDIAIIGGGIVGLAAAYKLQLYSPELEIVVLEKEAELAFHQTGRNSGVLHSGLYYKPGSLRAENCVKGRKQLVKFAKDNNINCDICGKIVVAVNKQEAERLVELKLNGEQNGLVGLKILTPSQFKKIEPNVEGVMALWVPETGIIDYKSVTNKLAEKVEAINKKSNVITSCKVFSYSNELIKTTRGDIKAKHIIFCGGLFADRLAKKDNIDLEMQIVGFRGDYFKLTKNAQSKVNNLIYPVPNADFPFLGVHFTRMINGDIECGPNAVFSFKREGYSRTSFNLQDTIQALTFVGTRRLFINQWKFGLNECRRAFSKSLFLKELQKIIPSLDKSDIVKAESGVRAMALKRDGSIIDDFKIMKNKNNIHVLSAPSPAATACLAIGDEIIKQAKSHFNI